MYPGDKRLSEARRLSSDSVFSPLRDSPGPGSASVSFNRRTPLNTPPTMSPLTIIREESNPTTTTQVPRPSLVKSISSNKLPENLSVQDKLSLDSLGSFVKETRCTSPLYQPQASQSQSVHTASHPYQEDASLPESQVDAIPMSTSQLKQSEKSGSVATISVSSNVSEIETPRPKSSELQNVLTAFPHLVQGSSSGTHMNRDISSAVDKISEKLSCESSPLMTGNKDQNMNNAEAFQREYISSVVSEAMQEWCDGVDKRLWSFHYSLLRQLQTHQEETRSMLSDMSGMSSVRG